MTAERGYHMGEFNSQMNSELKRLCAQLKIFLPKLGNKLLELRNQPELLVVERKSDGSKVCTGDHFSDRELSKFLKTYSDFPVISEEQELPKWFPYHPTWVIDPIDGTSHYINNGEDFAIMLALVVNKKPVFAMVYLPVKKLGYYAHRGQGAYRYQGCQSQGVDEIKLEVDAENKTSERLFQLSGFKAYLREYEWFVAQGIEKYHITGGIGVKLCKIAESSAHYYLNFTRPLKAWDVMPTSLIVEEAGGWVSDARGGVVTYDESGYSLTNGIFIAPDNHLVKHLNTGSNAYETSPLNN